MKKTVLMTGLALAIGLGALSEVRAQGMGEGQGEGMMGEGMEDMAARFEGADTDGDGLLSRDEITARMTERATARIATRVERMIAHHDSDGDGMLSAEELKAGQGGRMFDRLDADGDGTISREEFAKMRQMMQGGKHGKGHHGKGDRQGGHGKGHDQQGPVIHHHYYYNR